MIETTFSPKPSSSRIRRLPVGWRMALPVMVNVLVFLVMTAVIWQGGRILEHNWDVLQRITNGDRLLDIIESNADRSQSLIYRYLDKPNDGTLAEINRLSAEIRSELASTTIIADANTAHDLELVNQTSRQLFAGFEKLRVLNADIHELYGHRILRLTTEISDLYSILDQATHDTGNLQWPILTKSREAFNAALLMMNDHYYRADPDALARSGREIAAVTETASIMLDTARNDLNRTAVTALAARIDALAKSVKELSQSLASQAHLLEIEVNEPQARLSAIVHQIMTLERQRRSEAHRELYQSLTQVGGAAALVGVVFLAISFAISLIIARSVARPIAGLVDAMTAVAGGDYQRDISGLNEPDEIGAMARALEVFKANAQNKRLLEAEIQSQERRWRTVLENSPIGMSIIATASLKRLYVNPRALEMLGVGSEAEALGAPISQTFVDPSILDELVLRTLREGGLDQQEVERCRGDGSIWWCILHIRPLVVDWNLAFIVWQYDVTERRKFEADLRAAKERAEAALMALKATQQTLIESEKMATLGGLVAGVTHEINTPLGINLTTASLLHEESRRLTRALENGALRRSDLAQFLSLALESSELLESNCHRAAELIKSFKQVAVDQASEERRSFALHSYIEEVLISLGPQIKNPRVTITLACSDDLVIDSFPGPLAQVLTNLVLNSLRHAFPTDPAEHLAITIIVTTPTPEAVELVYADNGRGIAEDVLPHIFDPFFTTNRSGGGSGLGLNIVERLVRRRLGGDIAVASQPGLGTRFTVRFPCVA